MEISTIFSILNSLFFLKMEILTIFSILHYLFLTKLEILTIFSILNSLFLPKLEILTVFSILNSFFLPKLEILTLFSILINKKSGKLRITFDSLPRFFLYIHILKNELYFFLQKPLVFFKLHTIIFQFFDNTHSDTI